VHGGTTAVVRQVRQTPGWTRSLPQSDDIDESDQEALPPHLAKKKPHRIGLEALGEHVVPSVREARGQPRVGIGLQSQAASRTGSGPRERAHR